MAAISPNVSSEPQNGTGIQAEFPFNFSIVAATDVGVYVDGVRKTYSTHYGVTFGATSGTVTFTTPPASGTQILLISEPDYLQTSEFADQGAYNLSTVNMINRRGAIRDLVNHDLGTRALKVPLGDIAPDFPALQDMTGRVIGYDGERFVAVANEAVALAADLIRAERAADESGTAAASAIAAQLAVVGLLALAPRRASKATDTSVASSTALITDVDLTLPMGANSLVSMRGRINYSASEAGRVKWQHAGPAAPGGIQINRRAIAPGDVAYTGVAIDTTYSTADIAVLGAAGSGVIAFEGTIQNGPNAGNFAVKWAQNTSDPTPTKIKAGSFIEYVYLPSTASFAFASTAIAKLGAFTGPVSAGGHNVMSAVMPTALAHSYIETMAVGTQMQAQLFTGNYTVEVDGGSPFVVAGPAGNTWGFVNLFNGLPDQPHRVRISQGVPYDSDITLRVSGTSPNLTRPADIPTGYPLLQSPYSNYIAADGVFANDTNFGGSYAQRVWTVGCGFGLRFSATTTSVRIWLFEGFGTGRLVLLQDGIEIANLQPPSTASRYELFTMATGLSGTHEYEIKAISPTVPTYIHDLFVDTLSAAAHVALPCDAYYGDSIVAMGNSGLADARLGDAYILANSLARSAIRVGAGGTGVSVSAGNQSIKYGRENTSKITALTSTPTRVFVCYGVNDLFYNVPLATFQADYQALLSSIRAGLPSAKIYARAILPQYRNTDADRQFYNARISAAVAAVADANIVYVNTDGWIIGTAGSPDLIDNVHPNASGYAKIAAAQALVL